MRGSITMLKRGDVTVQTKYLDAKTVYWINDYGVESMNALHEKGFETSPNVVQEALKELEDIWDRSRGGRPATSLELEAVIRKLRDF